MRRRTRLALALVCVLVVLGGFLWLWFTSAAQPAPKSLAWTIQPDQFPVGTVLQGSRVEMTLGLFSGMRPAPLPGFISRLPSPLRPAAEWAATTVRTTAAKLSLRVRVEAPPFVRITEKQVLLHPYQGPFAVISLQLKTDRPGEWHGNLRIRLSGGPYGVTNIVVPLSAKVMAVAAPKKAVLITASPYQEYSTQDGANYEPLAALNSRLSQQGIRVDFCRTLPRRLSDYRGILLADTEMAGLGPPQMKQLKSFVGGGGRLILAATAFFVPTVPRANTLLQSYGLQIVDQDAGQAITNSRVISDVLTVGIKHVDFFRPSQINVTDPAQGKILVEAEDGQGGYIAVSRQSSRGDVVVLTQSLWWSWIRSDPAKADNSRLWEHLLAADLRSR